MILKKIDILKKTLDNSLLIEDNSLVVTEDILKLSVELDEFMNLYFKEQLNKKNSYCI